MFPQRIRIVHHEGSLDSGRLQIGVSLVLQIALFIFVAVAFIGSSWALYVGAVVFFAPLAATLFVDSIPKSQWMTKWKPTGLVMWTIVIVTGILLSRLLDSGISNGRLVEAIGFVVLPIPVLIFWTLELFEVNDEEGDEVVQTGIEPLHPEIEDEGALDSRIDDAASTERHERLSSLRKWAVRLGGVALLVLSVSLVLAHVASG